MKQQEATNGQAQKSLAGLAPGSTGVIASVRAGSEVRGRMMELGFVPGMEVRVVRLAPFGDPMEVELLGYKMSLRRSEALDVLLQAD